MSAKKLERSIKNIPSVTVSNLECTPIVLTDSKGWSIRRESRHLPQVQWEILNGATTDHYHKWISRNIASLQRRHNQVRIYLWTGTCDFTTKVGNLIHLNDNIDEAVSSYRNAIDQIEKLVAEHSKIKITYLPIPHLSIETWNRTKGDTESASYKEQDKKLKEIVETENRHLRTKNQNAGTYS